MEINKCENCINWSKRFNDKGKCIMSIKKNDLMQSGCGLITHKDFGCILFNKINYGNQKHIR